ncbi:unnamed protein product [Brachionus calyciflorus]|uniref:Uncharacterized protein n=1 Tax=Brachionus calyciflorus TaxID=104777 RepID=A0A813TFT4_9BILA|nr:unnamed protein product [Brachionus calyciflorus]
MTTFGPETPTPFCVSSEKQMRKSYKKLFEHCEEKMFKKAHSSEWNAIDATDSLEYEKKFCQSINKFLDIDCTDSLLFIRAKGDDDLRLGSSLTMNSYVKNWPLIIEENFCLSKKIDICEIRFLNEWEKRRDEMDFEFKPSYKCDFVRCENTNKKYDKIIMKNCLKYFDENPKDFCQFIMKFFKEQAQAKTSLLIIQRVGDLNTLPFHQSITKQWRENDAKYATFMEIMQNEFFSVKFDIEIFKYSIDCKSSWYTQLKNNELYPLNQKSSLIEDKIISSKDELISGIRELNETIFKYQPLDQYLELSDRMLFFGAHQQFNRQATLAERIKHRKQRTPYNAKLDEALDSEIRQLQMEITPEMRPLLNLIKSPRRKL